MDRGHTGDRAPASTGLEAAGPCCPEAHRIVGTNSLGPDDDSSWRLLDLEAMRHEGGRA